MLHDAGMKALCLALYPLALERIARIANALCARHHALESGKRKAAFPAVLSFVAQKLYRRIDEHRSRHPCVSASGSLLEPEADHPFAYADLRRRDADAAVRSHGVPEVGNERPEPGAPKVPHGKGVLEEPRISHMQNVSHHFPGSSADSFPRLFGSVRAKRFAHHIHRGAHAPVDDFLQRLEFNLAVRFPQARSRIH